MMCCPACCKTFSHTSNCHLCIPWHSMKRKRYMKILFQDTECIVLPISWFPQIPDFERNFLSSLARLLKSFSLGLELVNKVATKFFLVLLRFILPCQVVSFHFACWVFSSLSPLSPLALSKTLQGLCWTLHFRHIWIHEPYVSWYVSPLCPDMYQLLEMSFNFIKATEGGRCPSINSCWEHFPTVREKRIMSWSSFVKNNCIVWKLKCWKISGSTVLRCSCWCRGFCRHCLLLFRRGSSCPDGAQAVKKESHDVTPKTVWVEIINISQMHTMVHLQLYGGVVPILCNWCL